MTGVKQKSEVADVLSANDKQKLPSRRDVLIQRAAILGQPAGHAVSRVPAVIEATLQVAADQPEVRG